jgi:hypothetical protein
MMIRDDASEKKQSEGKRLHGEEMFRSIIHFSSTCLQGFQNRSIAAVLKADS